MVATAYARTYRTNAVMTASPGQLVLMLFDGALKAMETARAAFALKEEDPRQIKVINDQILKAQTIIIELQSGLNLEAGGEFARTLDRLYDYHNRRLLEANLRKDLAVLEEVERLVRNLRDAWAEMLTKQDASAVPADHIRGVA